MSAAPAPPVVRCDRVAKTYRGEAPVEALRPATFTVQSGEQVAVRGPSGSGKSTLLNLLGLLDAPTAGTYELAGADTSALPERERAGLRATAIGFVFQSFHLLPARTAVENVELGLLYHGLSGTRRRARARDVLGRVGLAHRADADVATLSGGERQRVAIARAVVHQPRLLLADEPTGNLDTATSEVVLDLLDDLSRDGFTQIIVTHDPAVAAHLPRQLEIVDGLVDSAARR